MNIFSSIRRTPYQSLMVLGTLIFSFTMLFIFAGSILLLTRIVGYIKTQPQATVYFVKDTKKATIFKLREDLVNTGQTRDVGYVSQEQALSYYKQLNKNDPEILEMVSKEALPQSLEIYAKDPSKLEGLAKLAKKNPAVENVDYEKDIVDNLIRITNSITAGALVFLGSQFLVVFFVLFMTTTFKIMRRKQEIDILRLLGASKYFVARPILKEGLFINVLASIVSIAMFVGGYLYLFPYIRTFLFGIPTLELIENLPISITIWPANIYFFALLGLSTMIIGGIITTISTFIAASKYIQ
ncbi:MAG: permease-like cell division protein FtsX [Candidatus Roizmanbacteria bacterium]|nr:permease-like cell division protein FtsX [Candidatus Roizmanbacteria bacterium]